MEVLFLCLTHLIFYIFCKEMSHQHLLREFHQPPPFSLYTQCNNCNYYCHKVGLTFYLSTKSFFLVEVITLMPLHSSHQRKAATGCLSNSSDNRISAAVSAISSTAVELSPPPLEMLITCELLAIELPNMSHRLQFKFHFLSIFIQKIKHKIVRKWREFQTPKWTVSIALQSLWHSSIHV